MSIHNMTVRTFRQTSFSWNILWNILLYIFSFAMSEKTYLIFLLKSSLSLKAAIPNLFDIREQFCGRQASHQCGMGSWGCGEQEAELRQLCEWSFTDSPAARSLQPLPNRPWTSIGPQPGVGDPCLKVYLKLPIFYWNIL